MSEHMIEDLVEGSIRALHARAPVGDRCVRDWFSVLYRFQETHDCSFTHFRVMDVLLERGFTYRFALTEHPEYPQRRAFFDGLAEFTALSEAGHPPDAEDWDDFDDWLDQGYVDPPHLYCDAGTALWRRMAETGKLDGHDAEPLPGTPLAEVVHEVALAAEDAGDIELIALWHAQGIDAFLGVAGIADARRMRAVRAFRDIALRTGAITFDLPHGYRPPPEFYEDDPLESWWAGADSAEYDDLFA
ncbi:hypothetical protein [Nocardia sp. NPDC050793]|uniref:hypothetical protein n=1 Tax=Nocardia sp. NPDC050793 TaxID=3155159 RepID=UPI0033C2D57E